jgi:hypothetical protein
VGEGGCGSRSRPTASSAPFDAPIDLHQVAADCSEQICAAGLIENRPSLLALRSAVRERVRVLVLRAKAIAMRLAVVTRMCMSTSTSRLSGDHGDTFAAVP